jgi:hypothetical protein
MQDFGDFLDQNPTLSAPPKALLSSTDLSEPYEIDEHGIFALWNGKFAYIAISGCSCWPSMGGTEVIEAETLAELNVKVYDAEGEYSRALAFPKWQQMIVEAKEKYGAMDGGTMEAIH